MAITMESGKVQLVATLTIANGAASSGYLRATDFAAFRTLTFVAGTTLSGALTLEALDHWSSDETSAANWRDVQDPPGTDVELAADKTLTVVTPAVPALRLTNQAGNEGGDRTIYVYGAI